MKHFSDKSNKMSRQVFDSAIITNSKGDKVGSIVVRYTNAKNATIGWNRETGIIFDPVQLNYETTHKGSTYETDAVYNMLASYGCRVLDWHKTPYYSYEFPRDKNTGRNSDSVNGCKDFKYIKLGNSLFTIHWV